MRIPRPGESLWLRQVCMITFGLLLLPVFWIEQRLFTITDPFLLALSVCVPAAALAWWFAYHVVRRRWYPD